MTDRPRTSTRGTAFWRRAQWLLRVGLVASIAFAVWAVGFSSGDGPAPVVPDTDSQFSLDLEVVGSAEHDLIYAVEQRARPFYRIFSLDPVSGMVETLYTVPEDAIIYGIALDPAGETLAVGYSPDYALEGSGIWTLDLASDELTEVVPVTPGVYLTDLSWTPDGGSVLATHVDRRAVDEVLSIARVTLDSTSVSVLAPDAINPVQVDDHVYFLRVDDDNARRSIGVVEPDGTLGRIEIGDSQYDLDHLLPGGEDTLLRVAVLDVDKGGPTFGEPASAHGNHDVASSFWSVSIDSEVLPTGIEPIIVYDAASNGDSIVSATTEGLAIGASSNVELIDSRAIRFVAT